MWIKGWKHFPRKSTKRRHRAGTSGATELVNSVAPTRRQLLLIGHEIREDCEILDIFGVKNKESEMAQMVYFHLAAASGIILFSRTYQSLLLSRWFLPGALQKPGLLHTACLCKKF